jgi:transposase
MEFCMSTIPKRVFTLEYRAEAIKLVTQQAIGVSEAANKLGLSVKTCSRWVRDARAGTLVRLDTYRTQPVTDLQAEVSRLKRELAIACEERDVLKKATAHPSTSSGHALRSSPSEVRVYSRDTG